MLTYLKLGILNGMCRTIHERRWSYNLPRRGDGKGRDRWQQQWLLPPTLTIDSQQLRISVEAMAAMLQMWNDGSGDPLEVTKLPYISDVGVAGGMWASSIARGSVQMAGAAATTVAGCRSGWWWSEMTRKKGFYDVSYFISCMVYPVMPHYTCHPLIWWNHIFMVHILFS